MVLLSRQCLIKDIKCLETKLSHLQERFDLIVNWIRSQYCEELSGLPDYVVVAVRGDEQGSRDISSLKKTDYVKVEYDNSDDSSYPNTSHELETDDRGEKVANLDDEILNEIKFRPVSSSSNLPATTVSEDATSFPLLFEHTVKRENQQLHDENSTDCNDIFSYDDENEFDKRRLDPLTSPERAVRDTQPEKLSTGINKRIKKTSKHIQAYREKGLILDADEYKQIVATLPEGRLNCAVCNKQFSTPTQIRRHELEVHLTKDERSKLRNRSSIPRVRRPPKILDAAEYKQMVATLPEGRLNCAVCNKQYSTPTQIRRHELEVHLTKDERIKLRKRSSLPHVRILPKVLDAAEYKQMVATLPEGRLNCAVCNKQFSTPTQIRRHELGVHLTKEERNKLINVATVATMCDICHLPFKNIESHKINHLPSEVIATVEGSRRPHYRCLKCDLLFPDKKKYYAQHTLKLRTEKNFLCNECGRSFNRKHQLKIHEMAVHANKKDFKCKYCGKAFVIEYLKNCHEKKHLGTSSVTCDLCGFSFTCKQTLRKHIKGVHENRRPYQCQLCDKSFKTSNARNYHVNTHGNPNGRQRGLNREVDPKKAAAKRRHCITWIQNRLQPLAELTTTGNDSENATDAAAVTKE